MIITSCSPLRLYLFDEGIVRLATEPFIDNFYSPYNLQDMCMHLTNYAINKDSDKFVSNEDPYADEGSKRSYKTVLERWRKEGRDVDKLLAEIEKIVVRTMISVEGELLHNYKACQPNDKEGAMCFEILGFDIIIDEDFKPYLLEVNHAPSFNTDTALDKISKNDMLLQTFTILGLDTGGKQRL